MNALCEGRWFLNRTFDLSLGSAGHAVAPCLVQSPSDNNLNKRPIRHEWMLAFVGVYPSVLRDKGKNLVRFKARLTGIGHIRSFTITRDGN